LPILSGFFVVLHAERITGKNMGEEFNQ